MSLVSKKAIKNILAAEFVVEVAAPAMWLSLPYQEERLLVQGSVEKRQREFAAGRACARKALTQLGVYSFPLLADGDRVPLWPEKIMGSISHAEDCCVVVVAKKGPSLQGVGIDVEYIQRGITEIMTMICVEEEQSFLARLSCEEEQAKYLTLIFSAKESVYKALYPSMRIPFDFNDFRITVNTCAEQFRVECLVDMAVLPKLVGRYFFTTKHVFTSCEYSI